MTDVRPVAHVLVVVGDDVLLERSVEEGCPVHRAPAVEVRQGETPGRAAERAARTRLGMTVEVERVVYADTEHGRDHSFFLARLLSDSRGRPAGVVAVRLAAVLAYVVEPRALARALARLRLQSGDSVV